MSILKYIGIPYVVGKESYDEADCYGLCKLYAKNELGVILPDYMYTTLDNEAVAEAAILTAKHGLGLGWTKVDKPEHGDIVTFRILGHETHCGIMLEGTQFLHSLAGRMSCIEDLTNINWTHRHAGSYRWQN